MSTYCHFLNYFLAVFIVLLSFFLFLSLPFEVDYFSSVPCLCFFLFSFSFCVFAICVCVSVVTMSSTCNIVYNSFFQVDGDLIWTQKPTLYTLTPPHVLYFGKHICHFVWGIRLIIILLINFICFCLLPLVLNYTWLFTPLLFPISGDIFTLACFLILNKCLV